MPLRDRRLLITGVATADSIAYAVAEQALLSGAHVTLTAAPRDFEHCRELAEVLPHGAHVIRADLTRQEDLDRLHEHVRCAYGTLDGVVHAVAFAPREALDGTLADAGPDGVELAFRTSTWSFAGLAAAVAPLFPAGRGSLVGLTFHSDGAWPTYNWMGVCKSALEATNRYLARDLGAQGARANLVAAGPLATRAAGGIPGFDALTRAWAEQAPLHWDVHDARPVADAVLFLLSDLARGITGEVLHVDGGFHAMAGPLRPAAEATPARPALHAVAPDPV
jgi:meromycolic acid enoyl-[acyl-carrier-protein] reductase